MVASPSSFAFRTGFHSLLTSWERRRLGGSIQHLQASGTAKPLRLGFKTQERRQQKCHRKLEDSGRRQGPVVHWTLGPYSQQDMWPC